MKRLTILLLLLASASPASAQNYDLSSMDEGKRVALVSDQSSGATTGIFRHKAKDGRVLVASGRVLTENAGLFVGSKEKPVPELQCLVYRYTGPKTKPIDPKELSLVKVDLDAKFINVFYDAVILGQGKSIATFGKPISGGAAELHIGGQQLTILDDKGKPSPDISFKSGRLRTDKFGEVEVFVDPSIDSPRPLLVLSAEAIKRLQKK